MPLRSALSPEERSKRINFSRLSKGTAKPAKPAKPAEHENLMALGKIDQGIVRKEERERDLNKRKQKTMEVHGVCDFIPHTTRNPDRARLHLLQATKDSIRLTEDVVDMINRYIPSMKDLSRGDLISLVMFSGCRFIGCEEDESKGNFIYDGEKALPLGKGGIPTSFSVPDEFPIRYWSDLIIDDFRVPFHFNRWVDQLKENVFYFKVDSPEGIVQFPASTFEDKGQKYVIVGENYDWIEEDGRQTPERTISTTSFLEALTQTSHLYIPQFPRNSGGDLSFIYKHFSGNYDMDHILRIHLGGSASDDAEWRFYASLMLGEIGD